MRDPHVRFDVNNMVNAGLPGGDFVVANTDAQALTMSRAERIIQMGATVNDLLGPPWAIWPAWRPCPERPDSSATPPSGLTTKAVQETLVAASNLACSS
jgi:hypothetical protein